MDPRGKEAETKFNVIERKDGLALLEAKPVTGRTHQIRLHLREAGLPIVGDPMYGTPADTSRRDGLMALRAVELEYQDPFLRKRVHIRATQEEFIQQFLSSGAEILPQARPAVQNKRATPRQR